MKTFEMEHEGVKYFYRVRPLKFGEVTECLREATGGGKISFVGGDVPALTLDIFSLMEAVVLKAVTKLDGSPITKQELHDLPQEVGDALTATAMSLTPIFRRVILGKLEQDTK
ncbi:MAG: hypothetical protein NZ941_00015 [Candidatus Caldarchaeum sp.]|nr:hypothetical protein [Candidatus Caldarchaeum sp.]